MATEAQKVETITAPRAFPEAQRRYIGSPNWLYNLHVLWLARVRLYKIAGIGFAVSLLVAFLIPKMYTSQARMMPPEMGGSSSALFAAIAGRAMGSDVLSSLAASLLGGHNTGALFIDLLRSDSVVGDLLNRFQLQQVYHKRYRVDAAKVLARRTRIVQDKKSGVITISVRDTDPVRARDMTQAYLDGLNNLVIRTSRSSAHQESEFIGKRLVEVKASLSRAEEAMSEFSSSHATIDLKEQAKATVESQARLQAALIVAKSDLESLQQIYGDASVRVRAAQARIGELQRELEKMGGSSLPLADTSSGSNATNDASSTSYLPLRQVPRLAVPYANLYREMRVQETVYDLLTQQYEIARIQEAKDIPVVNIIDAPGVPEKKSFPPRALLSLASTLVIVCIGSCVILMRHYWLLLDPSDSRRVFAGEVLAAIRPAVRVIRKGKAIA